MEPPPVPGQAKAAAAPKKAPPPLPRPLPDPDEGQEQTSLQHMQALGTHYVPDGQPPRLPDVASTSSLDDDPVHVRHELQEDLPVFETDAGEARHEPLVPIRGDGGGGVRSGSRHVQAPYLERDDVGTFAIYIGNWSGHRREELTWNHIRADLIARNPAQVLLAQEVNMAFHRRAPEPDTTCTRGHGAKHGHVQRSGSRNGTPGQLGPLESLLHEST